MFGERWDFFPMREVINGSPVSDETRDAIAGVVAIRCMEPEKKQAGEGLDRITACIRISMTCDAIPAGVKRFDRFMRADTGVTYEVTDSYPDDGGRIVVELLAR